MKLFTPLFLANLLAINAFLSQSPQESPELKESAALTTKVQTLLNERKFDDALPLAKRALEIRSKVLPPGDPQISTSLTYLADVYIARGDYGEARKVLQRLLQNQVQRIGPEHVGLAATLDRIAMLYAREGNYDQAENAYTRAIALKEKAYTAETVELARSLFGLAEVYRYRKDFEGAAPIYRRALSIYGQHLGVYSVEFERTSEAYSCLGYETGKLDKIKDLSEIWKRFRPNFPEAPPGTVLNGMALSLPRPEYSQEARVRRLSGTIIVRVLIDEAGRVIEAHDMCHGPAYLSQAAVSAARLARFSPTKLSGMPVKVRGEIRYNFVRY